MSLSREQLIKALGDVEDAALADILAMGATAEELAEAQAWITNDEALINSGKPPVSGRVSRLAEILTSIEDDDDPHQRSL
jgi:hypothetical protein